MLSSMLNTEGEVASEKNPMFLWLDGQLPARAALSFLFIIVGIII